MTLPQAKRVFAELMQKAREGTLTQHDKRELTQARQLLRRAKRPAMNPRKKTYLGDGFRKIWFSGRDGKTAGLVLSEQTFQNTRSMEAFSRLFPYSEANKMARFHKSPLFSTYEEAFAYPTSASLNPRHSAQSTSLKVGDIVKVDRFAVGKLTSERLSHRVFSDIAVVRQVVKERGMYTPRIEIEFPFGKRYWFDSDVLIRQEKKNPRSRLTRSRAKSNPSGIVRVGQGVEVRYKRDIGTQRGYFKHEIASRKAGVYTIPPGWVYVSTKSILITEREPRV